MFGTIRKHQTWLWAVIITLTIISFVTFLSPNSKMNSGSGSGNYGSIDGRKVTQAEYRQALEEASLHWFINTHHFPQDEKNSRFDQMQQTYNWLLLMRKEEEMGIHVGNEAMEQMAWHLIRQFEREQITSPAILIQKVLQPRGLADAFEGFVRHYVGLQQMIATHGMSGALVTPQEARLLYEREHQELTAEVAFFPASNHMAEVTVTPEALSQFYSNRMASYHIPQRVQVSYVRFNVTNFLAAAESEMKTNLNEVVEEKFRQLGTNSVSLFPEAKTPEEVKAKIRERLIRGQAFVAAQKQALQFATPLFDRPKEGVKALEALAKTNSLEVAVTPPFERDEAPKGLPVGEDFRKAAFGLTDDEPFAGPLVGEDGLYVIALNKILHDEQPSYDQVKDKVIGDYKQMQAANLARKAGQAFDQSLTNGLAQGKTFDAVCAESKITPLPLPPFSLSTQTLPQMEDTMSLDQFKQLAFGITPGKASGFLPTREGGMIVYVKARLPVDQSKLQTELPQYTSFLRRRLQDQAFNQWFSHEAERSLRDTPLARAQRPPTMGAGKAARS